MQAILGSSLGCYTYVRGHNTASKLLISLYSEKTIQGDAARPPFEAAGWAARLHMPFSNCVQLHRALTAGKMVVAGGFTPSSSREQALASPRLRQQHMQGFQCAFGLNQL